MLLIIRVLNQRPYNHQAPLNISTNNPLFAKYVHSYLQGGQRRHFHLVLTVAY